MRYAITVTGQIDTTYGPDIIRRDAGWILAQADHRILRETVQVTSVEPVPATPDEDVLAMLNDLSEFELDALTQLVQAVKAARA
jgi:hypothetical protein